MEAKLIHGLRKLCDHSRMLMTSCGKYLDLEVLSESNVEEIKSTLCELLLIPDCTVVVAHCFPFIILELLLLVEENRKRSTFTHHERSCNHKQMCVALAKLVNFHPEIVRYCLQYFESNPAPFHEPADCSLTQESAKKRKISSVKSHPVTDTEIVVSCYNFLQISHDYFKDCWKWSDFINLYVGHKDDFVCWLACQCVAVVTVMTDTQRQQFVDLFLTPEAVRVCTVKFDTVKAGCNIVNKNHTRNVPALEEYSCQVSNVIVSICGIQLPVFNPEAQEKDCFVLVDSTVANLRRLAVAIASGRAICLQGPVGSGKTSLVEHLALLTGRRTAPHFMKVQLGDQTDSKMLLGTYHCTDVPGEFVWQPGVLTQAVTGGHWILLEDIDSASADVLSVLTSLLETGTLSVPGYRDCVRVASGFQLFVTRRLMPNLTGFHSQHFNGPAFLEKHWVPINVESLSKEELVQIVKTMFPVLQTISARIVEVYLLFSVGNHSAPLTEIDKSSKTSVSVGKSDKVTVLDMGFLGTGQRLISTRDLIKWCTRSVEGFDVSSQESALKVFQDAIDVFCCSITDPDMRLKLAISVGACLGIVKTKAEYFCNSYKPTVKITSLTFMAGRVSLARHFDSFVKLESVVNRCDFTFTRPAACLLERLACCVAQKEPVLLVGETGTGKTSAVQYLADRTGHHLIVINMNQQSDSADLLGGYKPIDLKYVVEPVREEFVLLFKNFFSVHQNYKFLEHIETCFNSRDWTTLLKLMKHCQSAALKRLLAEESSDSVGKRLAWRQLGSKLVRLESQLKVQNALAFSFIEGSLVKALRKGHWVLLDEINLASAETLECLSGLLEGSADSLYLLERGDQEAIKRHPDFRLFACMNPANDVGKKNLPAGLRNRFTEFFVDELTEKTDLLLLVGTYLRDLSLPVAKLENLIKFYLNVKKEAALKLTDGTGLKPHYSLRTLCRALSVAAQNKCGSVPRSLYEALCLSFLTQLDYSSHPIVEQMVAKAVLGTGDASSILKQSIPQPVSTHSEQYVCFEGYWIPQGELSPNVDEKYILTPSVRRNLHDLVRIVSIGHHPVLLQGETSVGKTSLITYLAKASGNHCVRINNHEHTDLQEYIGSYSANERGHLVFKEGVLVEAMRKGHWIILDELNLAPTDVLEALNRVLDDNRELFIPETQDVVKAHPHFMLFATQNPPGLYGGRKMLSRAFRNRFVELHFDEIPAKELEIILHKKCDIPPSYCGKMVAIMADLQLRRRGSAAFAGKQGFITLRDLFRWGERYRLASQEEGKFYDWNQHIADEGYLVLAGRVRKQEECQVIQEVIKKHINRSVDPQKLFTLNSETSSVTRSILEKVLNSPLRGFEHIVWTFNLRRLAVLVGKACQFKEPVLLVGETGCGKTTVCQMLAALHKQTLFTVNCHMHTESSDFLGSLRPVREHCSDSESQKLFEWVDGPLIEAMQKGGLFLADEISLADDSVLERLNSLLEPERKLLLAEKGGEEIGTGKSSTVIAEENFHFIGTMNPGGDYGKKELSPALRNRFTEIWCESCRERQDLLAIIEHNLNPCLLLGNQEDGSSGVGNRLLDFVEWFSSMDIGKRFTVSVRDILSWINFINVCTEDGDCKKVKLDLPTAYVHGACLTFLDSLGSGITSIDSITNLKALRNGALKYLMEQVKVNIEDTAPVYSVITADTHFGIHPFYIKTGNVPVTPDTFTFTAPTSGLNASRVLRGLQLQKPILLEGSPGVGKTSLVAALAKAAGYQLTRINVSDQTDVSDLFGADLPIEGGEEGQFAWRDGPFLQALKAGHWILLDELNLASQSVLEGLNACLDHRGEVFIPELGRTFHVQFESTRLFGAQNPLKQGGARRGLPQSFLNRFTQVYIDSLTESDLEFILKTLFPALPRDLVGRMVKFNSRLVKETGELRLWGQKGAPWELNLRDLSRWSESIVADAMKSKSAEVGMNGSNVFSPGKFVDLIYVDRMRTREDKEKVKTIYAEEFGSECPLLCGFPHVHITHGAIFIDDISLFRDGMKLKQTNASVSEEFRESDPQKMEVDLKDSETGDVQSLPYQDSSLMLLRRQFPLLRSLARCVIMNWLAILVGPSGSGKTSVVQLLSQLLDQDLRILSVNSAMDTTEILGGFEQADYNRHLDEIAARIERLVLDAVRRRLLTSIDSSPGSSCRRDVTAGSCAVLRLWEDFRQLSIQDSGNELHTLATETELFSHRLTALQEVVATLMSESSQMCSFESELKTLKEKLNKLAQSVAKENSLNAGGKFEWVDSVLVKCLKDGSWLLVDNVNLCSPAVLDRLNALLEPGGVLTIGERGVGPDGKLVTIAPHPGFRLFLTMDPLNGEISRAMRNRGVEICILGSQEEEYSCLDLRSLLHHAGLKLHKQQDALLSVHQEMTLMNQGMGESMMSQLLHAAFLIAQQTSLGQPEYQAFLSSCSDVYVNSQLKSLNLPNFKLNSYQILKAVLKENLLQDTCRYSLEDKLSMDVVTLTTSKLKESAKFANIKQQGALLQSLLEAFTSFESETVTLEADAEIQVPDTRLLNKLLGVKTENESESVFKVTDIIPCFLVMFFGMATPSDLQLRYEWFLDLTARYKRQNRDIGKQDLLGKCEMVSETLKMNLTRAFSASLISQNDLVKNAYVDDLPWDIRWLPNLAALYRSLDKTQTSALNKLSLLLYFESKRIFEKRVTHQENVRKRNSLTVMEYSAGLLQGVLTDEVTSHCVVTQFAPLLRQFDTCLVAALKSQNTALDNAEYSNLYGNLEWRFRLFELGDLQLINSTEGGSTSRTRVAVKEAVSKLSVHYNWLAKWTLPKLRLLLEQDKDLRSSELVKQFECTVQRIESSLQVSLSPFLHIGKRVRQSMGQPLPHATQQQFELWQMSESLLKAVCIWQSSTSTKCRESAQMISFLLSENGRKARVALISVYQQLVLEENFDEVAKTMIQVKETLPKVGPDITITDEDSLSAVTRNKPEVQLWPVHELICVKLGAALRSTLMNNVARCEKKEIDAASTSALKLTFSYEEIAKNLTCVMVSLPTIPPQLVGMVKLLIVRNELLADLSCDRTKQLVQKLMILMLQHSMNSPCISQLKDWLNWSGNTEMGMDSIEYETTPKDMIPLHCPVMTHLVTTFVVPSYLNNSISTTLGSHKSCRLQLSGMKEILWRNMKILSMKELDYGLNDGVSVEKSFRIFIQSLTAAIFVDGSQVSEETDVAQVKRLAESLNIHKSEDQRQSSMPVSREIMQERKQFSDTLLLLAETVARLKNNIDIATNISPTNSSRCADYTELLVSTGGVWVLLGFLQVNLYANLGLIDPVIKRKLKLEHISNEAGEIEKKLYAQDLQSRVHRTSLNELDEHSLHPDILMLRNKLDCLMKKQEELKKCVAVRPDPQLFSKLSEEALYYSRSLASSEKVLSIYRRIVDMFCQLKVQSLDDNDKMALINNAEQIIAEGISWHISQQQSYNKINEFSIWYPDMVVPILSAATQLSYGMHLLVSILCKQVIQVKMTMRDGQASVDNMLYNLVRFPTIGEGQTSIMALIQTCTSDAMITFLHKVLTRENKPKQPREEAYRLLKSSLIELKNLIMIRGEIQPDVLMTITQLLGQVVVAWRLQEDERKQKEKDQESLYLIKGTTQGKTLSDEEQETMELQELFPSSSADDFGDLLQEDTLDHIPVTEEGTKVTLVDMVTLEDMNYICQLHSSILQSYTATAWLSPSFGSGKYSHLRLDFIEPLLKRYKTFGLLLEELCRGLDSSMDIKLYPSLLLLTSVSLNITDSGITKFSDAGDLPLPASPARHGKLRTSPSKVKTYDFYKDSFVTEVKKCLLLLTSLTTRVEELLAQWPEHPTLNQMLVIVKRIESFPLTSPVSRFLTGLELLLDKMHEWEENAHSGVSLAVNWKAVTDQIGSWRKLELQCWKDSLDSAASRVKAAASKWWFYIYSLVESFIEAEQSASAQDLVKTLQKFMEQSTLGEYEARLNILFTFHCHTVHLQQSSRRDELMNILWNIYIYYSQFSDNVAAKLKELRSPIEKKLKDCVKIFRWDDISHWAIKEAIKKVHKTLHKHIRQFKEVLNQPVIIALSDPSTDMAEVNVGIWDRPQRHQPRTYQALLEPMHFVSNTKLKKLAVEDESCKVEGMLLSRCASLFMKARKLCRETITGTPYAKYVQTVDGLVTEVIETSNHLRDLKVSDDLTKAKQKSQAKNFLQQKQKALADLFRTLQKLGLSYRTGLTFWNPDEANTVEFVLPPLDLRAAFQHLKNRRVDGQLLSVWDGCETYFLRSVARLTLLNTALQNPSKDLGPPAIERCRGFALHLMVLSREQKLLLCESSQLLCSLRCQVSQLTALEEADVVLPKQLELQTWMTKLKEMLTTCIICLEQFRILLYCCPSDEDHISTSGVEIPVLELSENMACPLVNQARKGDQIWKIAIEKVKLMICCASKLSTAVERSEIVSLNLYNVGAEKSCVIVAPAQYDVMVDAYKQVGEFVNDINILVEIFEPQHTQKSESDFQKIEGSQTEGSVNPIVESLVWLKHRIAAETAEFSLFVKSNESVTEECEETAGTSTEQASEQEQSVAEQNPLVKKFKSDTEKFLKSMLMVMQEVYKKYIKKVDEPDEDTIVNEEEMENNKEKDKVKESEFEENLEEENKIEDGYLREKVVESLSATISEFHMKKISEDLQRLMQQLLTILDADDAVQEGIICKRLLVRSLPCLDQLVLLYQFFVTQQVASYRVSCKMLSVLLAIFLELAQKGFCIPTEFAANEEGSQTGNTAGGMGLGEGEGEKDVSDQIESEDQLEEARPQGEEKTEEDRECKEEEKGIEMSEDFDGKIQDLDKKEDEDDSDKENEEEEPDKEMGETDMGADKLDQQIWGSDSEEEGDEDEGQDKEEKMEERGSGEKLGETELAAKEDDAQSGADSDGEGTGKQKPKKKDINEMDDPDKNDDQIDPYHGRHEPQPEPEPLDLPEDLQLDEGEKKEGADEGEEENPFDIDKMKDQKTPEDENDKEEKSEDKGEEDEEEKHDDDSSDEVGNGDEKRDEDQDEAGNTDNTRGEEARKDEDGTEDEPKMDIDEDVARPSEDRPADAPAEAAMEVDNVYGSKDQVVPDEEKDKSTKGQQPEDSNAEGKEEKQGVGQAQTEETDTGHRGELTAPKDSVQSGSHQKELQKEKRQRLKQSDDNRSLGEASEPVKKKLRTMNITMEEDNKEQEEVEEEGAGHENNADMYQHIKEAKKSSDIQTLDAATEEQAEKQPVPNLEEEVGDEPKEDDNMELQEDSLSENNEIPKQTADKVSSDKKQTKDEKTSYENADENGDVQMIVDVEGERVDTLGAARGSETTFHTIFNEVGASASPQERISAEDYYALRSQLESQLASWIQPPPSAEAETAWQLFSAVTAGLARDLSEQLRLVLEPTQSSRLRGDYRTGRRINMRKVIPYIASQFRKDKIWLRRTKPSKREYQIVLAIDDSSSMADNHSKELAFESLALVSRALTLLEAGELAVISFGESPKVLHQLGDPFTELSGARLLQQFSFEQKNTRVGQLVDFATTMFTGTRSRASSGNERAQLLVIVSDGRIISEGTDRVKQAVRRARQNGIFMVFVIVDNPKSKDSVLDIQQPMFSGSKCVGFSSYLDSFPFPFYLILRDINALPTVLSDALRQWFELVTNVDKS